jgi:hypothetical protein
MKLFKTKSFYIIALILSILGVVFTIIYAIPATATLPGISKYSSYLILAFFAFHIYFYSRALWLATISKKETDTHKQ